MGWSCVLLKLPDWLPSGVDLEPGDWPADLVVPKLGTHEEVRELLAAAFPDGEHQETQSMIRGQSDFLLFNHLVTKGETLVSSLGVDSGGDTWALGIIQAACERLGLRGLDCQTGQILDFSAATDKSAREFREFRDRALGRDSGPP